MGRWVEVRNRTQDRHVLTARWCDSFTCRLRGLTFRRTLPPGEGLLLVGPETVASDHEPSW